MTMPEFTTPSPSTPSTPRTGAPSEDRLAEEVETAIEALLAGVVDDDTLAEWFRPGYLLEVASLLDRLRTPPDLGEIGTLLDEYGLECFARGERHPKARVIRAKLDRALASLQARAVRAERDAERFAKLCRYGGTIPHHSSIERVREDADAFFAEMDKIAAARPTPGEPTNG